MLAPDTGRKPRRGGCEVLTGLTGTEYLGRQRRIALARELRARGWHVTNQRVLAIDGYAANIIRALGGADPGARTEVARAIAAVLGVEQIDAEGFPVRS